MKFDIRQVKAFEKSYDSSRESLAVQARDDFLAAFPIGSLSTLKLNDYVIGFQAPTFCTHVEVKTRPWASIQGATSKKFGIYFGRTKSDPEKKYQVVYRFGETPSEAFKAVKKALLNLVDLAKHPKLDFLAIDNNALSQMFKAKILSLYFPERFLNICSPSDLVELGEKLGLGRGRSYSEYQHLLLMKKLTTQGMQGWTNPKFMTFLYQTYLPNRAKKGATLIFAPKKKVHRRVNFEDIQEQRSQIGIIAEDYAMEWERKRLIDEGLDGLVSKIVDRRDRPGHGYDFLSHSSNVEHRFIEVKAVRKLPGGAGHRFFLSENEHMISKSRDHIEGYYFYLVFFDSASKPVDLLPISAADLYRQVEMDPVSYAVRFALRSNRQNE